MDPFITCITLRALLGPQLHPKGSGKSCVSATHRRPRSLWANSGGSKSMDGRHFSQSPSSPRGSGDLLRWRCTRPADPSLQHRTCSGSGSPVWEQGHQTRTRFRAPIAATHQRTRRTAWESSAPVLSSRERQTEDNPPGGRVPGDPEMGGGWSRGRPHGGQRGLQIRGMELVKMSLQECAPAHAHREDGGHEWSGRQARGEAVKPGEREEGPHCRDTFHQTQKDTRSHQSPGMRR